MNTAHESPSHSHGQADEHGSDQHVGHIVPMKILTAVFLSLTVLTVVTYLVSLVDFGELNLLVAMAIAVIKASLVVLFFMHLYWDKPFNALVFVGCLIFVGLFISLALLDTTQYHKSVDTKQAGGMTHVPMPAENAPEHPGGGH